MVEKLSFSDSLHATTTVMYKVPHDPNEAQDNTYSIGEVAWISIADLKMATPPTSEDRGSNSCIIAYSAMQLDNSQLKNGCLATWT